MAGTTTTKAKVPTSVHVGISNLLITVLGFFGYYHPGFTIHSSTVQTVVPAVAAAAISVLTAVFSHSKTALLNDVQKIANTTQSVVPANSTVADAITKLEADLNALKGQA